MNDHTRQRIIHAAGLSDELVAALELEEQATRLIEESMKPATSRKHKWATGKEKYEALQRDGRKHALPGTLTGPVSTRKPTKPLDRFALFMSALEDLQPVLLVNPAAAQELGELLKLELDSLLADGLIDREIFESCQMLLEM